MHAPASAVDTVPPTILHKVEASIAGFWMSSSQHSLLLAFAVAATTQAQAKNLATAQAQAQAPAATLAQAAVSPTMQMACLGLASSLALALLRALTLALVPWALATQLTPPQVHTATLEQGTLPNLALTLAMAAAQAATQV